jgi:hypothetical protein
LLDFFPTSHTFLRILLLTWRPQPPVTLPIPLELPPLCTVIRHLDFISKTWQEEEFPKTVEMLPQS